MPSFKEPGFQERATAAAQAKSKALAQLRAKPPIDEATVAARAAAREAREAAQAEKREATRRAKEEAAAAKAAALESARQAEAAAQALLQQPKLTEAERKAARDARYADRKKRKSSR